MSPFVVRVTARSRPVGGASQSIDTATVFAAILLVTLMGVLLMELGLRVERHYAAWRNIQ